MSVIGNAVLPNAKMLAQILKALVENCGTRFQSQSISVLPESQTHAFLSATFANERLVDRIKIMAADPHTPEEVKKKLAVVLVSWRNQFKDDPRMSLVAGLYDQVKVSLS